MLRFLVGFATGATVATYFDLKPFYNENVRPNLENGIDKVKDLVNKSKKE